MTKETTCPECGCVLTSDLMSADPQRKRFFAKLRDVHSNLSPRHAQRWPSAEVLRKHALIAAGHCDTMTVAAGSKAAVEPLVEAFKAMDRYCIVVPSGTVLTIYRARSMSRKHLLRPQFHEVAEKCFAWIESQTGIDGRLSEAA